MDLVSDDYMKYQFQISIFKRVVHASWKLHSAPMVPISNCHSSWRGKSSATSILLWTSPVKDSDLLEMTGLKKLPSETRTEALLVKYVAYFGIWQ